MVIPPAAARGGQIPQKAGYGPIDFLWLGEGSRSARFGFDLSRNIACVVCAEIR